MSDELLPPSRRAGDIKADIEKEIWRVIHNNFFFSSRNQLTFVADFTLDPHFIYKPLTFFKHSLHLFSAVDLFLFLLIFSFFFFFRRLNVEKIDSYVMIITVLSGERSEQSQAGSLK